MVRMRARAGWGGWGGGWGGVEAETIHGMLVVMAVCGSLFVPRQRQVRGEGQVLLPAVWRLCNVHA